MMDDHCFALGAIWCDGDDDYRDYGASQAPSEKRWRSRGVRCVLRYWKDVSEVSQGLWKSNDGRVLRPEEVDPMHALNIVRMLYNNLIAPDFMWQIDHTRQWTFTYEEDQVIAMFRFIDLCHGYVYDERLTQRFKYICDNIKELTGVDV